jgi:lipopolysaccharide export system permease protein
MKILSRYIIREHIPPFLFALAVLMFIFLMQFMLKYITKIFGKGLSAITIIELVFYNLAWMFALAVPMSVLIATLMSFGRLSGDNEITILKSSGISIYRIIRPALIFGAAITVLMIIFNDRVLPDFNHRARVMFSNIGQKKATLKLEPGIFFTVGKCSFHVEKIEKTLGKELSERLNILGPEFSSDPTLDRLRQVTIFDNRDPSKIITLIADEGYMVYSKKKKSLLFALFDCEYHELNTVDTEEYRFSHLSRYNFTLSAPEFELENRDDNVRGDREMDVEMMLERVHTFAREKSDEAGKIIKKIDERVDTIPDEAPATRIDSDTVKLSGIDAMSWRQAADQANRRINREYQSLRISSSRIQNSDRMMNSYMVEIHKKFSIPFASIVFILIGAPLGIAARRGSLGIGATLSILFFLVYWACLILGEDLADRQFLPPLVAMWFPNIVLGLIGGYLTWRTVKETTIIRWEKLARFFRRKKLIQMDEDDNS